MNINYNKSRTNWERTSMLIHDKSLGIVHPALNPAMNFHNRVSASQCSLIVTLESAESTLESTNTSTTNNSKKQLKLLPSDKAKIIEMFQSLDLDKCWKLSTGTVVEEKMKEYAIDCNYEHPVHSLVLDTSDKIWKNYFSNEELFEIKRYNNKQFRDLPVLLRTYLDSLKESNDAASLKKKLDKEQTCPACEWVRNTLLEYFTLFKWGYLPLTYQLEGDVIRRVWRFIDTFFDDSKIICRGVEKTSRSSSASINTNRTFAGIEKMERKLMGRKLDLTFYRQLFEYGCCECGRSEDQTKELLDDSKMAKVLKDMIYSLYQKSPDSLRELALVGFLLFDTKFTIILCDSPAGYVCRINHKRTLDLPEEADDICNALLPVLTAVYKSRVMMKDTNKLVKQKPVDIDADLDQCKTILPSFTSEGFKRKRRCSDSTEQ
ncbi:hypothetical protein RMATCC62417_03540 [Rhizopus microsporus]|nr:hypothetical protein RMATCC62417_03540 [Rhizopus microsporus]